MDTFSTRLRTLRKAAGYSQERLGIEAGIGRGAGWFYENAHHEPGAYALKNIADVLNVSTDYLLCRTEKRKTNKVFVADKRTETEKEKER